MSVSLTDSNEDVLYGWRELQLAATAPAGVRRLNPNRSSGSGADRAETSSNNLNPGLKP
jgi:hypothetical protein